MPRTMRHKCSRSSCLYRTNLGTSESSLQLVLIQRYHKATPRGKPCRQESRKPTVPKVWAACRSQTLLLSLSLFWDIPRRGRGHIPALEARPLHADSMSRLPLQAIDDTTSRCSICSLLIFRKSSMPNVSAAAS